MIVYVIFHDFLLSCKRQVLGEQNLCQSTQNNRFLLCVQYIWKSYLHQKKVIWKKQIFEYKVMTSSGIVSKANNYGS